MKSKLITVGKYPQYANKGKQVKLSTLLKEYRKTASQIAKSQWIVFFLKGKFDRYVSLKHIQSKLSEIYKQTCLWQVISLLESWTSNLANRFRQIVINSTLPQERKKALLYLNSFKGKPSFKHIAMHLDQKVAVLEKNTHSKSFEYWLKVSTLEKRKPVYIPLKANKYIENLEGELINFYQLIEEDGKLKVKLVKEIEDKKDRYIPAVESIKKYKQIVRRFREFLRNEMNRYINRLIEVYRPKKIVVEKLDFRSPELSKRMNRLIQNFGNRYIKEKLRRLQEVYGIEVVEINPAYTSQECNSCGYIDRRNRKDTEEFECKLCGKRANAQVNSAKNVLKRASLLGLRPTIAKKKVLEVLVKRHLERLRGCNSAALEVLKGNPYYRDYLNDFLNSCSGGNRFL